MTKGWLVEPFHLIGTWPLELVWNLAFGSWRLMFASFPPCSLPIEKGYIKHYLPVFLRNGMGYNFQEA
jgi:hypothetical protein